MGGVHPKSKVISQPRPPPDSSRVRTSQIEFIFQQLFHGAILARLGDDIAARSVSDAAAMAGDGGRRNHAHCLIAPLLFCDVEAAVRQAEHFIHRQIGASRRKPRKCRPSHRARARQTALVAQVKFLHCSQPSGFVTPAARHHLRSAARNTTKNSSPPQRIRKSDSRTRRVRRCCNLHQHAISGIVAILVVYVLEVVDIDHKEKQVAVIAAIDFRSTIGAHGLAGVRRNHALKETAIADAGQRIAERGFLQFAVRPRQFRAALSHGPLQAFVLAPIPIPVQEMAKTSSTTPPMPTISVNHRCHHGAETVNEYSADSPLLQSRRIAGHLKRIIPRRKER